MYSVNVPSKSKKQNNLQRIRNTGSSSNKIKINKPDPTFKKCFCSCQGTVAFYKLILFLYIDRKNRYEMRKKGERTVLKKSTFYGRQRQIRIRIYLVQAL
jgi:hypothetical protein